MLYSHIVLVTRVGQKRTVPCVVVHTKALGRPVRITFGVRIYNDRHGYVTHVAMFNGVVRGERVIRGPVPIFAHFQSCREDLLSYIVIIFLDQRWTSRGVKQLVDQLV